MKNNPIIYGKKIVLFPFRIETDLEKLAGLLCSDRSGYMGQFCLKKMSPAEAQHYLKIMVSTSQMYIWTCMIKDRKIGFIYLTSLTSFSANINGIMDYEIAKGLSKEIRKGKYTYAEDAFTAMVNGCFEDFNMLRVETSIIDGNTNSKNICKKIGFKEEGRLREAFRINDKYKDILKFGILKKEWEDGQRSSIGGSPGVQVAG